MIAVVESHVDVADAACVGGSGLSVGGVAVAALGLAAGSLLRGAHGRLDRAGAQVLASTRNPVVDAARHTVSGTGRTR